MDKDKRNKLHMTSIILSDGRSLGYAEYGNLHGKPVFFFHGSPGSRYFRPPDEITCRLGVHLICVDRPGYGESTFQPDRRILDWPDDITELADNIGIDRFAVAGHSGGGPYIEVCAYALPNRVVAGAVVSGAGPMNAPDATHGMTAKNKLGLSIGHFVPWPLWRVLIWIFYHRRAEDPAADIDHGTGHRPQADEEQILKIDVRQACIQSEVVAFRSGLRGLAWDTRLLTRPWGFTLSDIRVPISLWHGTADDQAPVSMARYVAKQISSSSLHILENEAHLLLFPHWEEILRELISK
jgi:pimeloyl-ACP methyl ester carboxylesterase